jgi:hypothetical protein
MLFKTYNWPQVALHRHRNVAQGGLETETAAEIRAVARAFVCNIQNVGEPPGCRS